MTTRRIARLMLGGALALGLQLGATPAAAQEATAPALQLMSSRVSLAGTSNIHPYTASSTAARLVRVRLAASAGGASEWDALLAPGALEAFEIAIPAATLSSPKDGLDKNMHKALKVEAHPDIVFRLTRLEGDTAGTRRGVGVLRIAGAEREVTLALTVERTGAHLTVRGELPLLMTDFGIAPPKAMLGMLKTDPKVTVTFEVVLGVPRT